MRQEDADALFGGSEKPKKTSTGMDSLFEDIPVEQEYNPAAEMDTLDAVIVGIGKGITDTGKYLTHGLKKGSEALGLSAEDPLGLMSQGSSKQYRKEWNKEEQLFDPLRKDHGTALGIGEAVGMTLPTMAIPGLGTSSLLAKGMGQVAPKAGAMMGQGLPNAMLAGAEAMGAYGTAYGYGNPQNDDPSLANAAAGAFDPRMLAMGAAVGGAIQAPRSIFNVLNKGNRSPTQAQIVQQAADDLGMPLTSSEVNSSAGGKALEKLQSYVPFSGIRRFRNLQFDQTVPAVSKIINGFDNEAGIVSTNTFTGVVKDVYGKAKTNNSNLFKQAQVIASKEGTPTFTPEKTVSYLQSEVNRLKNLSAPEAKGLAREIQERLSSIYKPIIDPKTKEITGYSGMRFDSFLDEMRFLTGEINQAKKSAEAGSMVADKARVLRTMKQHLWEDLADIKAGSPELRAAAKAARDDYKVNIVPFKDKRVLDLMKGTLAADKMLKSLQATEAGQYKAQSILSKMGPEELGVVRRDLAMIAKKHSETPSAVNAAEGFNMKNFLKEMNEYNELRGNIFGESMPKLNAFMTALESAQAGWHGAPKQIIMGGALTAAGAAAGIGGTMWLADNYKAPILTAAGTMYLFSKMTRDPTGSRFLKTTQKLANTAGVSPKLAEAIHKKTADYVRKAYVTMPAIYKGKDLLTNKDLQEE